MSSGRNSGALRPYRKLNRNSCNLQRELYRLQPNKLKTILKEVNLPKHLISCASFNDLDGLRMWLEAGVSPNSTDAQKRTALHVAASKGYEETVQLLLDANADPNKQDILGNTPLHLAFCAAHIKVCVSLMSNGASSNIRDARGNTVLNLLISKFGILRMGLAKKQLSPAKYSKHVTEMMKLVPYIWRSLQTHIIPTDRQLNFGPSPFNASSLLKSVVRKMKAVHPSLTNEELTVACPDPFLKSILDDVENLTIEEIRRTPPMITITSSSSTESNGEPNDSFNLEEMQAALCSNLSVNIENELLSLEQQFGGVTLSS